MELKLARKTEKGTFVTEQVLSIAGKDEYENGGRKFKLTIPMLDKMVENFAAQRAKGHPTPAGFFGHARTPEAITRRQSEDPALFITSVWRQGDKLMGTVEYMPAAYDRVVAGGAMAWRGGSIVFTENDKDEHGEPIGPTLRGFDLVHEPFLPVQIAADAANGVNVYLSSFVEFSTGADDKGNHTQNAGQGDEDMDLKEIEAKLEKLSKAQESSDERNKALAADNEKLSKENAELKAKADARDKAEAEEKEIAAGKAAQETITGLLKSGALVKADVEGYDKDPKVAGAMLVRLSSVALGRIASGKVVKFEKKSAGRTDEPEGEPEGDDKAAHAKMLSRVSERFPNATDEQKEELVGQQPFMDKIEETILNSRKAGQPVTYRQAIALAAQNHPDEHKAYLTALGRAQ